MKKIVSIIVATMLVLMATIPSFAITNDGISSETEAQIQQAVYSKYIEDKYPDATADDVMVKYFTTASDGGIYFRYDFIGTLQVVEEVKIGDYTYSYTCGEDLYLFKNGEAYKLKEAYESGIIDDKMLAELADMNIGLVKNSENISSETEAQIQQAVYSKYIEGKYPDATADDVMVKYFTTASDGGIYFRYDFIGTLQVVEEVEIGDYTYSYTCGEDLYLFKNGVAYKLKEAYESGIIDDKMLAELADMNIGLVKNSENISSETEAQIQQAVYSKYIEGEYPDATADDVMVKYFTTASDGGIYFRYDFIGTLQVVEEVKIGDYTYSYTCGEDLYLFKNGEAYKLKEAYESGIIDDKMLAELADMNIGLVKNSTQPTKPTSITDDSLDNFTLLFNADNYSVYTHKSAVCDALVYQCLDKYVIVNTSTTPDFSGMYFIYYNEKMYTVPQAFEAGYFDEEDFVSKLPKSDVAVHGDANDDGVLNITDVTSIQKKIAYSSSQSFDVVNYTCDFDGNQKIDIKDVTLIQKQLIK